MNLENFISWYENISEKSLNDIDIFYAQEVFFKDPFNEFSSRSEVKHLFENMFENLDAPKFIFSDIVSQDNNIFITWDFDFILKGKQWSIHGSTHLKLGEDAKIIYHRDYWDVGEEVLLKIPGIKKIYSFFRDKLSHKEKIYEHTN